MTAHQRLALLLAAGLVLLAAPAAPAPHPVQFDDVMPLPGSYGEWRGDGSDAMTSAAVAEAVVAAAGQVHGRALLQGAGGAAQREPLPNFEIGVPAPPTKTFKQWQASMVREREQHFSSSTFLTPGHPGLGYVAICVIARDAHADMLEWINHHVRLGVSKIYLWDHASMPPMQTVVQGYISAGIVEYQHFSEFQHASGKPQLYAYDQCLQRGHLHTWMAFIDVDEFLMFRDPWPAIQSLPAFLAGFEGPQAPPTAVSGLAVHWIIFGSSGHEMRPGGGVLRNYHRCLQLRHAQHALVKTIVRTACTAGVEGPHNFQHNCSMSVLQTDKMPIAGPRSKEPVHTSLALHHYAIKSREEFALKMVRGSAMRRQRGWEFFDFVDEWSTEFNWDGLMIWDTVATFQHYPALTQEHLQRYTSEQHENFWLKGADDPRYKEQLRQKEAAEATAAAVAVQQQQVQQASAGVAVAGQQQAAAAGAGSGAGGEAAAVQAQQAEGAAAATAAGAQQQVTDMGAQNQAGAAAGADAQQQQIAAGAVIQQAVQQEQIVGVGQQQQQQAVATEQQQAAATQQAAAEVTGMQGGAGAVQQQ